MPIYEYECLECGVRFDRLQRFGDPQPEVCPNGHRRVHRLLSHPAIIFKGSGFYVTDNPKNGRSKPSGGGRSDKKSESAPSTKVEETDD